MSDVSLHEVTRDNWQAALQLTVNPENAAAQRMYLNAGFQPTGEVRFEEVVYRRALSAP